MAKHHCERCGIPIANRSKNNVTSVEVDDAEFTWEVEMAIISLGYFCDECRKFILKSALVQFA